jgi:hypothetical protein
VQPEIVDPHRGGVGGPDLVRALVDDLRPHVLQQGQDVGERERFTAAVELQPGRRVDGLVGAVEVQCEAVARLVGEQRLEPADVADGRAGRVVVLVARRHRVRVAVVEQQALFLAELLDERVGEVVGPGAQRGREPRLDRRRVVVGHGARPGVDDEVQPGHGRVGDQRRLLGVHTVERRHQRLADVHVDRLGEPAQRQVDEAGEEPLEAVAAHPQPQPLAVLQLQDRDGVAVQVVDLGLQQLVARVAVQDVDEHLRLVVVPRVGGALQHRAHLPPHDRDVEQRLLGDVLRVQPEEAALAGGPALRVEPPDADVVEVAPALHGRPGVGLGQVEQARAGVLPPHVGWQRRHRVRHRLPAGAAQDAQARLGHRLQHLFAGARHDLVLAVAEEGEVAVGEPAQELRGLVPVVGRDDRGVCLEARRDRGRAVAHGGLVLVGRADVAEHPHQVEAQPFQDVGVGLTVDLDVVEGLPAGVLRGRRVIVVDGEQLTRVVAADGEHRVERDVQAEPVAGQLGGERVGDERHVLRHHLHHRVRRGEAVLVEGR